MAAILDHLTAILVGASLLGVLLFVQHRSGQAAVEATVHQAAQTQAFSIMESIERDADNMRLIVGARPQVAQSEGRTTRLTFHTLDDPSDGENASVVAVTYRLESTYRTMTVDGQERTIYRIARYVNDGVDDDGDGSLYDYTGGSTEGVLSFDARLISRDGTTAISNGDAPDDFSRVSVNLAVAIEGPARVAGDQAATATTNVSQQGRTFRPLTLTTVSDAGPDPIPDPSAPLPPLPSPPPTP